MFKFLRKYNKWILAVGGTLLMVVFLVPQAIQSLSQKAATTGAVWATVGPDNRDVSADTRRQCEKELEVIDRLRAVDPSLAVTNDPAHWYLLVLEADMAGLVGARPSDVLTPQQMQLLYTVTGQSPTVDEALGKRLAVDRMFMMYRNAAMLSDARLRRGAERLFHAVDARTVIFEATADRDAPDPSEAEIVEQFEAFRDVDPGEGEQGFGYRLPDRLKVEWLTISADTVREMIEQSGALNGVAPFKHWQRNQAARGFPPYKSGAPVPAEVRQDLLDELTAQTLDDIEKFIADRLFTSWRKLKTREGYLELPDEGWAEQRVQFDDLGEGIQAEFAPLAAPVYQAIGDRWLTPPEIDALEGLGTAGSDKYGAQLTLASTLIAAAKEFGGDNAILVQEGVAGPILRDRDDGGITVFRITATDPARPPRDVDEVRDQIVSDLRRRADYRRLLERADSIEAAGRSEGLLGVAMDEGVPMTLAERVTLYNPFLLNFQLQNNVPLSLSPNALPVLGEDVPTIKQIIDKALDLPRDAPVADAPSEKRIFVVPVENKMALMLVEVTKQYPLSQETFSQLTGSGALQRLITNEEFPDPSKVISDAFSFDALAKRHNFELKRRATDDGSADTDVASASE